MWLVLAYLGICCQTIQLCTYNSQLFDHIHIHRHYPPQNIHILEKDRNDCESMSLIKFVGGWIKETIVPEKIIASTFCNDKIFHFKIDASIRNWSKGIAELVLQCFRYRGKHLDVFFQNSNYINHWNLGTVSTA